MIGIYKITNTLNGKIYVGQIKTADLYSYTGMTFYGTYELRDYLQSNGYHKISQGTIYKIRDGERVRGYDSLLGKITREVISL